MANKVSMPVVKRASSGKGAARATRRAGLIPAVIYGDKKPAETISVEPKEIGKQMRIKGFRTRQFELVLEGKSELALCQNIQFDKVKDTPMHIDFLRIDPNKEIYIEIPFVFVGEAASPGLKAGGVLNIETRAAPVVCKPADIVDEIQVDVSAMEISDSLHSGAITLPKGIRFEDSEPFTVCTIAAAVAEVVEEVAPVAATEVPTSGDLKKEAEGKTDAKDAKPEAKPAAAAKDEKKK